MVRFISHEVRTPLNTVVMGLNYLESVLLHKNDTMNSTSNNIGIAILDIICDLYIYT